MAIVYFYEKPGCMTNTRQKKILAAAGHEVIARNLLTTVWTSSELRKFFTGLPIAEWFNRSAPAIKQGVIDPDRVTEEQALQLMLKDPLLIRRPLLQVNHDYRAGFDLQLLEHWIGVTVREEHQDLENCPRGPQLPGTCQ